jgi:beta-lactamase class A
LSLQSTCVLTTMMLRCNTGPNRLAGRMPAQTLVAHKTGTLGRTANDVGVIELPMNVKIVVAIFIKKSTASLETREQVIADIARSIRDYFLYV